MIPIFSQLPRLRPAKVAARHFIDGRSHPSFAKEWNLARNNPFDEDFKVLTDLLKR